MEEAYWKQFMTTGRVEDYLHFKGVSNIEGKMQAEEENVIKATTDRDKRQSERESLR